MKFMTPELINERKDYNEKVDAYSFGVVVYWILMKGEYPSIKLVEVANGKQAKIPNTMSDFSIELIRRCWSVYPKDRPSFNEICELFFYHGSRIANHKGIITKHFSIPFDEKDIDLAKIERRDKGYFGKGIYATDNMFYAAAYANGAFNLLTYNKKAPVICWLSIFNTRCPETYLASQDLIRLKVFFFNFLIPQELIIYYW